MAPILEPLLFMTAPILEFLPQGFGRLTQNEGVLLNMRSFIKVFSLNLFKVNLGKA